jgi:hypothetical protein
MNHELEPFGRSHGDPVDLLHLDVPNHPARSPEDLLEGKGFVGHLGPLQRCLQSHLVEAKTTLAQRHHSAAMEGRGHRRSRQAPKAKLL